MSNTSFLTSLNAALSNGGLTASHSNSSNGGARSGDFKASGKYYFEITVTTLTNNNSCIGILQGAFAIIDSIAAGATSVAALFKGGGNIWSNGGSSLSLGSVNNGDVIGVAVDYTNSKIHFRKAPSGNWNGNATHDPATNTGGASFSSLVGGSSPCLTFSGDNTEAMTANFGDSAFSGAVPSGFTAGWPGAAGTVAGLLVNPGMRGGMI